MKRQWKQCKRLVISGILVTLGWSCRSIQKNPSDLFHETDRPVMDAFPMQWLTISDSEYQSVLMSGFQEEFGIKSSGIVSAEHPARQRLQYHMDRLDEMIRRKHPRELAGVPRPIAQIILTPDNNAVVHPISLCLGRAANLSSFTGRRSTRFWEYSRFAGQFIADPEPAKPMLCVHRSFTDTDVQSLTDWNLKVTDSCSAKLSGSTFQLDNGCSNLFKDSNIAPHTDNLVVLAVPNAVTYYAGIFAETSEEEVIFWVAHELAHYYRAHPTTPSKTFVTYYRLSDRNPLGRPSQSPDLLSLAKRVDELSLIIEEKGIEGLNAAQRQEWKQINLKAYQERIGQYTKEQESDELGMEWALEYGLNSDVPLKALLNDLRKLGSGPRQPAPFDSWDYSRCQKAFAADWKNLDEAPVFVPVGDYSEEHHSDCYRAFNLHREIETHGYPSSSSVKPVLLSAAAWKNLQDLVARDIAKAQN